MTTNLEKTLQGLEKDDVITVSRDSSGTPTSIELSDAERQCGRENYDFYCFLIWPFIEASWLGSVSLLGLTPPIDEQKDIWIDLKKAQDSAQLVGLFLTHFQIILNLIMRPAWQNVVPSRRLILFRSRQQRDSQERIPTLRRRRHHTCSQEQRITRCTRDEACTRMDSSTRTVNGQAGASWTPLGLHRVDCSV